MTHPQSSAGTGGLADLRRDVIELREWKAAIIGKCKASDGFDALEWGGDKEGWGFIHYFIGHLETRALHAETVLAERDHIRAVPQGVLGWLATKTNYELSYSGWDNEDPTWEVHSVNGGRNDREWTLLATGSTPEEALRKAMSLSLSRPQRVPQ